MLFNSFGFLFLFLPITLGCARFLKGQMLLRWLTLASFLFYSLAGHAWFLIPMLITTVLDFFLGQKIEGSSDPRKKRMLLYCSLVGNLGLLIYFKYADLFLRTGVGLFSVFSPEAAAPAWLNIFKVILPAGISFYTFQTLSYIIDVYRGDCHAERNFWKFAGFVSFFPHLVAGPLTRHHQLIPSLEEISKNGIRSRWEEGIYLFSIGLAKKVLIADRVANLIDPVIANISEVGMFTAWAAILGYAFQIYFDFSGYSDMAIGLGRIFGVELPQNFNSPYRAVNPSDFWRRWHITLSQWLRDYLYITVGGNRCSARRQKFNLLATMVLGGLWHGASWTFAAWGLFHGLLLVIYHQFEDQWNGLNRYLQRGLTFALVCIGWVFFRADDFHHARVWLGRMFGVRGLGAQNLTDTFGPLAAFLLLCLCVVNLLPNASGFRTFKNIEPWQRAGLGVMTAIAILFMTQSSKFLYFQF